VRDNPILKPVFVSTDQETGPTLIVPLSQLDDFRRLLDANHIAYEVDDDIYSFNDEPELVFVNIQEGTSAEPIQRLLDSMPQTPR